MVTARPQRIRSAARPRGALDLQCFVHVHRCWRTAAIVLCDLASTAYYIGGVVESQIGKAAPWFILAVMVFSYAVRSIYIESCSMFVRGGVYRVVKEAMGHGMAKVSVSALMFDYVLTGTDQCGVGRALPGPASESLPGSLRRERASRGGRSRGRGGALFLSDQCPRHPGVEHEGSANHAGDDRDGRGHDRLVSRDAGRPPRDEDTASAGSELGKKFERGRQAARSTR